VLASFSVPEKLLCTLIPSYANEGLPICVHQVGPGSGEGQNPVPLRDFRYSYRSESRRPSKGAGSGPSA
jgi:hypothetical protein